MNTYSIAMYISTLSIRYILQIAFFRSNCSAFNGSLMMIAGSIIERKKATQTKEWLLPLFILNNLFIHSKRAAIWIIKIRLLKTWNNLSTGTKISQLSIKKHGNVCFTKDNLVINSLDQFLYFARVSTNLCRNMCATCIYI